VLFIIYMTPVVMIILFAFQNYPAIAPKRQPERFNPNQLLWGAGFTSS
jgi:hypothetical protein